eukprot:scaffold3752_cov137-Cylindrotheca_fusiformis.AAC.2
MGECDVNWRSGSICEMRELLVCCVAGCRSSGQACVTTRSRQRVSDQPGERRNSAQKRRHSEWFRLPGPTKMTRNRPTRLQLEDVWKNILHAHKRKKTRSGSLSSLPDPFSELNTV